jgi:hypothetical protein
MLMSRITKNGAKFTTGEDEEMKGKKLSTAEKR